MTTHAITVLGQDRPGIIAETTSTLAGLGLNLEDSTMTLLRGHFAMMLVTGGEVRRAEILRALIGLTDDGSLSVTVREVVEREPAGRAAVHLLSVHGGDRPGIVSSLLGEVARVGGNVTDLQTRLSGSLYVLLAECVLPTDVDVPALESSLREVAAGLGVEASLRPVESDEL